nr:MAG TPA: Terminase large subunit [Caudoviricetes sp.]DAV73825.1 MAG TPA: Terminase large subunit [Bacteriophage sp.]
MIAFGTGGTEGSSFDGLKNLFYKPEAFNCLAFPNIWDDGQE